MAQFTNQAQLSYNNTVVNSNVAVGDIIDVLSSTKTSVGNTYGTGDSVTYVITLVNSGNTPLTGITVNDDLGSYTFNGTTLYPLNYTDGSALFYINGVLQPAPTVTAGPPLVFSGITIPANSNAAIVYEANVNNYAPLSNGATVVNTINVNSPGRANPITAQSTINALDTADLTITKSIEPATVTANSTVTYNFVIQNYGSAEATAADNVILTDTFNPILTGVTASLNGKAISSPADYTYDEATGQFATTAGTITVPEAAYVQNADGTFTVTPGVTTLTVTGVI